MATLDGPSLQLRYTSKDGEEGYPGALTVKATYTLTENNELKLEFTATTDKDTVLNLTQHSYFNLAGKGDILNHVVTINADRFTPVETANYICHRLEVAGHSGPMPFTTGAIIRIAEYSEGNPRRINTLCFNALSLCCAVKRKQVDRAVVEEVIADQDLSSLLPTSASEYGKTDAKPAIQQNHARAERVRIRWPRVRRIMMTAAVLVFGFMCLSGIGPKWQPEVAAATTSATTSASVANGTLVAALSQQAQSAAVPDVASSQAERTRTATETVVVTVAPHQTLREISMQHLGGFDAAQLKQIRGLNPGLDDPNHVQAGQRIRLPRDSRSSKATTQQSVIADRN